LEVFIIMRITRRSLAHVSTLVVVVAAAGMASLAGPVAEATPAPPAAAGVITHTVTGAPASRAAIASYWTPQRMRHAISADKMVPARSAPTRQAGAAPATGPATTLARPQAALATKPPAAPANSTQGSTSTSTLTQSNAQGKLFFHDPWTGYDEACSAGTVGNPAKDMVFTAAHCLWGWTSDGNTGGWMTQVMFAPAYYNGNAPYGKWSANHLTTFPEYSNNKDSNYDIGVINVSPDPNDGSLLVNRVGGNGLSYNAGYSVTVDVFGYPQSYYAGGPYNGEIPYACDSVPTYQNGSRIETGCDMTNGGSGGSWLLYYNSTTGLGNINGLTSQTDPNQAGYIVSPYFDNKIPTIYGQTQNL
jgi:hypothetical protein